MARTKGEPKPKKSFQDLFASYKTYNPEVEGYGSESEWKSSFRDRMGFEEAEILVADGSPREILGVSLGATWAEIKVAYRKKVMEVHPDRCVINHMSPEAATEAFKKVQAAFTVLEREFGK